ncbi:5'-methylthioadenosine/S-adenosylhomocysteine nucleosidase [Actinomycetaceae bacterium TAE3-ERU4]|nr:5'-methylthioadenosine/S-adenosylhomocysteine nucleosidase [Actinomycetaceae bacterium TAE3-ERU4]
MNETQWHTPTAPTSVDAVVVCAMPEEVKPFLELNDIALSGRELDPTNPDFCFGRARGWAMRTADFSALVVECGIGLANAAAASAMFLHLSGAGLLISAGSAGGLGKDIEVGDVVVSSLTRYGQVDATAFGYKPGQVPGEPEVFTSPQAIVSLAEKAGAKVGEVISNDTFVMSHNVNQFRDRFPAALATDMESAAHAQTALHFGARFVAIRGISDLCGPRADQENHLDAERVSAASAEVTQVVISAFATALEVARQAQCHNSENVSEDSPEKETK